MDTGLAGKVVLVTGGAGGIGSECVRAFAAEGARVVVHYNTSRERAEELATEIGSIAIGADLTDEAAVESLFTRAREELGGVDVCAAVAGVWPRDDEPVWKLPLDRWETVLRANLTATFLTAKWLPARGGAHGPRQPRPRRLDRGPLRRGGARRLRRREVGHPGRAAPEPEERDRPRRAPRRA